MYLLLFILTEKNNMINFSVAKAILILVDFKYYFVHLNNARKTRNLFLRHKRGQRDMFKDLMILFFCNSTYVICYVSYIFG